MRRTTTITLPTPPAIATRGLRAAAAVLLDIADRIDAEGPTHFDPEDDATLWAPAQRDDPEDTTTQPQPQPQPNDVRPCPRCNLPPRSIYAPKTYRYSGGRTQTKHQAYCHRCQRVYSIGPAGTTRTRTTPNRAR